MRKVAVIFIVAVLTPSIVLAWLALRSLRDQHYLLEHQRSMLFQGVADALAREVQAYVAERQREFNLQVESLLADQSPQEVAAYFDDHLQKTWPWAEVGFAVTLDGNILAPSLLGRSDARRFRLDNDKFLSNRGTVEVYWNSPKGSINLSQLEEAREDFKKSYKFNRDQNAALANSLAQGASASALNNAIRNEANNQTVSPWANNQITANRQQEYSQQMQSRYGLNTKFQNVPRKVIPQSESQLEANTQSKVASAEAEFRQLIGDATEGMMARFLQNQLKLLIWYRSPRDTQVIFGAQLNLRRLVDGLRNLIRAEPSLQQEICVALLDDGGKPVAQSHAQVRSDWKRPFVATEIGEILPHWEIGIYLLNPAKLSQSAQALKLTFGLLIVLMLLAIGIGGWLIVKDLRRELTLARQKTDFVSNVSHELKTPLTSIRMFSELLAEGRIKDPLKQNTYLHIITAEAARLTRLINNVLDFARIERGEKKYHFARGDVVALVNETIDMYRPHLEANGYQFTSQLPDQPMYAKGDRDALAQVLVNLLSNAEKYSGERKEIQVQIRSQTTSLPVIEVQVCDRGMGVPKGCEEKIFEKFFRAHDSLASGIQGSGLGLTLARQIARAHGGEVVYQEREGGGSCFILRLPMIGESA